MRGPLLEALQVSKSFGGFRVLENVSTSVSRGRLTLLAGPNGSGKTTLLNILSGVLSPDGGRVLFKGIDVTELPPHERFRLGLARSFQTPLPFRSLSVLENLLVPLRFYEEEKPLNMLLSRSWIREEEEALERAWKILDLVGLGEVWDKPAGKLSGGQMKLLELARALMGEPDVLLLDEPLAGVNPSLARRIMSSLRRLAGEGLGVLFVEHRLDIALSYADYVYVLHRGVVIAEGSPQEVVGSPCVLSAYLAAG
ncbi:MAG: ABC transporter ATP-binding protein [Thermofilum sp.]